MGVLGSALAHKSKIKLGLGSKQGDEHRVGSFESILLCKIRSKSVLGSSE